MKVESTSPTSSALAEADLEEFHSLNITEVADRLKSMRLQEDKSYFCTDYLKQISSPNMIDKICRNKMLVWCLKGADFGLCRRETVVISMSYLDRFLSSGTPRATNAIKNRKDYQLASVTALYMAIKLFDPLKMSTADLVILCEKSFAAIDFAQMELDILSALNWHVHGPTVLSFIEHFLAFVPSTWSNTVRETLIHKSKQYTEITLGDYYFVTQKPSTIAFVIVYNSLKNISSDQLNKADRLSFLSRIANSSKIDLWSHEINSASKRVASIPCFISDIESKPSSAIPCKVTRHSTRVLPNNLIFFSYLRHCSRKNDADFRLLYLRHDAQKIHKELEICTLNHPTENVTKL